jgi:hypothetical protein
MGIGSILGGIAGLLIPGGGAIASALGSGIGTLLEGGSGKDAIKNALLAGGTSAMFPGVASAIQQSAMGKAATGMFGGTPAALTLRLLVQGSPERLLVQGSPEPLAKWALLANYTA